MDELAVMASKIAIDPVAGLANLAAQLALDPQRSINAEDLARLFRQAGEASAAAGSAATKPKGGTDPDRAEQMRVLRERLERAKQLCRE